MKNFPKKDENPGIVIYLEKENKSKKT